MTSEEFDARVARIRSEVFDPERCHVDIDDLAFDLLAELGSREEGVAYWSGLIDEAKAVVALRAEMKDACPWWACA